MSVKSSLLCDWGCGGLNDAVPIKQHTRAHSGGIAAGGGCIASPGLGGRIGGSVDSLVDRSLAASTFNQGRTHFERAGTKLSDL